MIRDWSLLPKELLSIISENLDDCFDLVHARSVCTTWRSTFPFPSCLLRPSYSLPGFNEQTLENEGSCTLQKIPLFVFRRRHTREYFSGGIGQRDESSEDDRTAPIQCSVKVEIVQGSDGRHYPTLMNMLDCQIFPQGQQYRLTGWEPKTYRGAVFLPVNNKDGGGGGGGGEGFVVILNYNSDLVVLKSEEMRWKRLENIQPKALCLNLVTFRGRFYAAFERKIVSIDPCSLEVTVLMPSPRSSLKYMVPSGDEELFLVEVIVPPFKVVSFDRFACRVSRLDAEVGRWVEVSDLGDRVLVIKEQMESVCLSAKELPHGCGVSGNSFLFTNWPDPDHDIGGTCFFYKYGLQGEEEGIVSDWRTSSREYCVKIFKKSPVLALRVEPYAQNLSLDA